MQALLECTELKSRGHEVNLLCHPGSRLQKEAEQSGIETLPLELRSTAYALALGALRRYLIQNRIDVVHAQLSQDLPAVVPAAVFISRPPAIVLTKRVGSFISKKDPFHRWLYRHVALVIAISTVIHKNIHDTCPIDTGRVVTLFDGVDLDRFNRARLDARAVRREFGLGENSLVIGMVGRLSPGKGHEEFLRAAEIIHARFPEVRFLVVGQPSYGEEAYGESIHRMAEPLVRGGVLIFTGFRTDIPEIMAGLDILAFPSHAEAFGDVLIEAMAMELPVVSTNCDGVLDIVVDGETGLQVPPKDEKALADGLIKLIQDEELRNKIGTVGRKRAEEVFSLRKRTERMEELYARVLGRSTDRVSPSKQFLPQETV